MIKPHNPHEDDETLNEIQEILDTGVTTQLWREQEETDIHY